MTTREQHPREIEVAHVEEKAAAIDHTPIYYIRVTKPIRTGTLLRWDTASGKIERVRE